ncbi:unnamed protein product [Clonostachys rhizophaga]|uniref:SMP-30/Gluconolactonase/LRE-like region domain-containing protein n=1 Tax=Clonostachys rhizophaga TaxID=160324 RepID=A0A9N9W2G3_9HYPO|nr:unnamed protein product [Clonostachys rhizophaga]
MSPQAAQQLFEFKGTFIENLHVLPNGNLLLSTFKSPGLLYTLDPKAKEPTPKAINGFGNSTAVTGIVPLGGDRFAIGGGVHTSFAFERGTMQVYIVSLDTNEVVSSVPVPDTATINGLAPLPGTKDVVLGADTIDGRIFAINLTTKNVSVLLDHATLKPSTISGYGPPLGINGIRAYKDYVYFTNSGEGTFARFRVEGGSKVGDVEIVARIPKTGLAFDDFIFDSEGNAYIATHPGSIIKVNTDGEVSTIAGDGPDSIFREATSVAMSLDQKSLYVSTGGDFIKQTVGGQIIEVQL